MNERHSYSFLLEYILAIVMFVICATICISVFTSSYKKNEIANVTKGALEVATSYIEKGDYSNRDFSSDDVTFSINEIDSAHNRLEIVAIYENSELFSFEFYGGNYGEE